MPDRQHFSHFTAKAKAKQWWFFAILSVTALACISCSDAAPSQEKTVQSLHVTKAGMMPLTNIAPLQGDMTPVVSVSTPQSTLTAAPTVPPFSSTATPTAIVNSSLSYEAEASQNTLASGAKSISCSGCSGGRKVAYIGLNTKTNINGTLQFNNVSEGSPGNYTLTLYYIDGDAGRTVYMSVNSGPEITINVSGTNDDNWNMVRTTTTTVNLNAGKNSIKFYNMSHGAPDIDRIVV